MLKIFSMVLSGIMLGLTIGLSPSPIMTLSIAQTIKYNVREGIKVAFAPVFTDIPIAATAILVISKLPNQEFWLGIIFILGSFFIARLGVKGLQSKAIEITKETESPNSIKRGIITNFLNPNVYVFWFTIGSVAVIESWKLSPGTAILYLLGFYIFLIGSRVCISVAVSKTKIFSHPKGYIISMRILGSFLIMFSIYYLIEGFGKLF